jgi:hypothetical protein
MWRDEIVEEIRRIRQEQAARFGYNIAAIVADSRRRQQEGNRKVVSFPPRRTRPADAKAP